MEKTALNLVDKDFMPGLLYVTVSRVKALNELMFEKSLNYQRFKAKESVGTLYIPIELRCTTVIQYTNALYSYIWFMILVVVR